MRVDPASSVRAKAGVEVRPIRDPNASLQEGPRFVGRRAKPSEPTSEELSPKT
jgi:hypothetical protein